MTSPPDANHHSHNGGTQDGVDNHVAGPGPQDDAADDSNEARGARAYARIQEDCWNRNSQQLTSATSSYSDPPRSRLGGNRKRHPLLRPRPPITYAKNSKQLRSSALFAPQTGSHDENAGHTEDDAVRRAIEMSLADQGPPTSSVRSNSPVDAMDTPHDVVPAEKCSLLSRYATVSTSTAPNAPLGNMATRMNVFADRLENHANKGWPVNAWTLAKSIREWEKSITKVDHELDAAERGRRGDLDIHFKFDRETEEKHRVQVARIEQAWRRKLQDRDAEWKQIMDRHKEQYRTEMKEQKDLYMKELEEQKQMYEGEIAQQTVEAVSTGSFSGRRSRSRLAQALSPSPTIATLQQNGVTVPRNVQTKDHGEDELQMPTLRKIPSHGTHDQSSDFKRFDTKETSEDHVHQHKQASDEAAASDVKGKRRRHKHDSYKGRTREEGNTSIERASHSPEKRKRDSGCTDGTEKRSWSPKKTKSK